MRLSCEIFVVTLLCGLQCVLCLMTGVTIGDKQCGQKKCKQWDYCSDFDKSCEPCKDVCDVSTHNFDKTQCENNCQDYLLDRTYVRRDGRNEEGNEDLRGTVHQLSRMVTVTLTLVCLMILVLAIVLCFQLYRWKIKKNITLASIKNKLLGKKVPDDTTPSKNNIQMPDTKKSELRLEMPTTVTQSDHSPVTVTTSISRRPAEDSTLDYAYDNPAMASSPK